MSAAHPGLQAWVGDSQPRGGGRLTRVRTRACVLIRGLAGRRLGILWCSRCVRARGEYAFASMADASGHPQERRLIADRSADSGGDGLHRDVAAVGRAGGEIRDPGSGADGVSARLSQLRGFRVRPDRAVAIGGLVDVVRREAARNRRQAGSFVEAWESVIPSPLVETTRVKGLRGGVARVGVRDAAARYELDAGLRGGWLGELRLACGQPVRSVRLEIDASIPESPADAG